jgi:hypothetical protein
LPRRAGYHVSRNGEEYEMRDRTRFLMNILASIVALGIAGYALGAILYPMWYLRWTHPDIVRDCTAIGSYLGLMVGAIVNVRMKS